MYVYMYIYVYVCMYVCMCVYCACFILMYRSLRSSTNAMNVLIT